MDEADRLLAAQPSPARGRAELVARAQAKVERDVVVIHAQALTFSSSGIVRQPAAARAPFTSR
jgi:hypothetical protein